MATYLLPFVAVRVPRIEVNTYKVRSQELFMILFLTYHQDIDYRTRGEHTTGMEKPYIGRSQTFGSWFHIDH